MFGPGTGLLRGCSRFVLFLAGAAAGFEAPGRDVLGGARRQRLDREDVEVARLAEGPGDGAPRWLVALEESGWAAPARTA